MEMALAPSPLYCVPGQAFLGAWLQLTNYLPTRRQVISGFSAHANPLEVRPSTPYNSFR